MNSFPLSFTISLGTFQSLIHWLAVHLAAISEDPSTAGMTGCIVQKSHFRGKMLCVAREDLDVTTVPVLN